jgi:dienelactone hydrolase
MKPSHWLLVFIAAWRTATQAVGLALCLGVASLGALAQTPAELPLANDLREEVVRWPITLQDASGRSENKALVLTLFKPQGAGPFPLLVLNHGRAPTPQARAAQRRLRYERLARFWLAQGFAVIVPTRVGYGPESEGFDPEFTGACKQPNHAVMAKATSDQVLAAIAYASTQPDLDTTRWLVAGQSVGGFASIATVARQPRGLLGGINFSGGTGGNPDIKPKQPCGVEFLADFWHQQAARNTLPMLWIYWQNDLYWGEKVPLLWHQAWLQGGGRAEFHHLPPVGNDGHNGMNLDMVHWTPLVLRFLQTLGFAAAKPVTP